MEGVSPYKQRHFRFSGIRDLAGIQFKLYTIVCRESERISDRKITDALDYIRLNLPSVRQQEGPDHGLGYIILHAGEMSNWLLIHWWAHQDVAMRLLASADIGDDRFKSEDTRRFHACVWEHVVIDHERNAWVERAMTNAGTATDYLDDRLADGAY